MRIFISSVDLTGTKKTNRLTLSNCTTTTQVIRQIAKVVEKNKAYLIIKLKCEPFHLRIVEGWPISHYPIKNGCNFIIEEIDRGVEPSSLNEIEEQSEHSEEEIFSGEDEGSAKMSFISSEGKCDESKYLDESLENLLEAVRQGNLDKVAEILKSEPDIEDQSEVERIMKIKQNYLLNQVGECGRNSLHWAIHQNNAEITSFLLIKGVNPTILTIDEYTPLQLAVLHRSPQIMNLLLQQKNIDPNQVTTRGTALYLAVLNEDLNCLQLLLKNGADPEVPNLDLVTPIKICKHQQIQKILLKRINFTKVVIPYITKGNVYKLSSFSRVKEKELMVNPFRNEFTISKMDTVQEKYAILEIKSANLQMEKSWLMKSDLHYFKLQIGNQSHVFGVKNQNICLRWIEAIKQSFAYADNAKYNKIVLPEEQIIEMLNDEQNQIKLHKRKIQKEEGRRNSISIMNLKHKEEEDFTTKKEPIIHFQAPKQSKQSKSSQISKDTDSPQDHFRQSQILIGSVIEEKPFIINSAPQRQSRSSVTFEEYQQDARKDEIKISSTSFRKNSQSKIQIVSEFKLEEKPEKTKISYNDFEIIRLLGNGAFGTVYLAKYKPSGNNFALKVLNKKKLMGKKALKYAVSQANILKKLDCPFVIKLHYAFQTPSNLYMALDHCSNGDLSELLTVKEKLSESTARFIVGQIILAVEYLHKHKVLYRDLKPENILISKDGYICVTDFGLSKENNFAASFCGSHAYLSPEMLQKKGVGFSSDIYGIGCVLYQMLIGEPPFFDENMEILYENIRSGRLRFPGYITKQARSLITKLLERDIQKRIGVKSMNQVKQHQFFKGFDWKKLARKGLQSPPEMMMNEQDQYDQLLQLDKIEQKQKKLFDSDYEKTSEMINRIKNFTFVRQDDLKVADERKNEE